MPMTRRTYSPFHHPLAIVSLLAAACTPPQPPALEPGPHEPPPALPPLAPLAAAQQSPAASADALLADAIARGVVAACPSGSGQPDPVARERCADGLTALDLLRDSLHDPVFWGGQSPGAGYDVSKSRTTQMNARVLRRMYMSVFAFGPEYRIEPMATGVVLHVATRFYDQLDAGDYPYPFWHSAGKWQSYERSKEMLFFVERGEVTAVLRSSEQDAERPHVEHGWDGKWTWQSERGEEPRNALYTSLFSPGNPHIAALDAAYRAFEDKQRKSRCVSCHDPSNFAKASSLELFSYPNQALTGRHDIVRELRANEMPPASADTPPGIADEAYRTELLGLAERFAALGDEALRFEGERIPAAAAH
jgi:hypothetical protein